MSLLSTVLGFSIFGLTARFGQLGIQKRNLFENMGGHAAAMAIFGTAGYFFHQWDERAAVLLAEKRREIAERRLHKAEAESS